MNKKQIFATLMAFLFSCLIVVVGMHPYSIYAKIAGITNYAKEPTALYRVYLAGESLGVIESKQELEDYIDEKQQVIKDKYKVDKVYAPSDLKIIKEITYNEKISDVKDIYSKIKKIKGTSSFTIDGYKIEIEGISKKQENSSEIKEDTSADTKTETIVLYVLDKTIFQNSVTRTITAFIDTDTYEAYLNDTQEKIEENKTGSYVDNLHIDNNIKIIKQRIPAAENIYTTEDELSKFLLFGTTAEQEKYTVKEGDTISEIANNNKLSIEEFLIANTNFKSENDLLFPGQVVNLGLITPQFDFVEERTLATEKTIQKNTVYKDDNTQYTGYEKVEEEGKEGLALVTEAQKLVNGEIKDTATISNITLVPAIDKVIIRGTKKKEVSSSSIGPGNVNVPVGIGSWVWPTNTPYTISSPFGYRWGKLHDGIDITGPGYGSPIKAANNGVVVQSSYTGYNGNYIIIAHSNNYYSYYGHMSSRYKQVGDVVMANDVIGAMGQTGYAFGVHLHFSLYRGYPWRGGVAFNPFNMYR